MTKYKASLHCVASGCQMWWNHCCIVDKHEASLHCVSECVFRPLEKVKLFLHRWQIDKYKASPNCVYCCASSSILIKKPLVTLLTSISLLPTMGLSMYFKVHRCSVIFIAYLTIMRLSPPLWLLVFLWHIVKNWMSLIKEPINECNQWY